MSFLKLREDSESLPKVGHFEKKLELIWVNVFLKYKTSFDKNLKIKNLDKWCFILNQAF